MTQTNETSLGDSNYGLTRSERLRFDLRLPEPEWPRHTGRRLHGHGDREAVSDRPSDLTAVQELENCQTDNLNHWDADAPPSWRELFILARRIDALEAANKPEPEIDNHEEE